MGIRYLSRILFKGKNWTKMKFKSAKTKSLNVMTFTFVALLFLLYTVKTINDYMTDTIACFELSVDGGFPDITDDIDNEPPKGKSIFFHETSCNTSPGWTITINARQACAVESAARLNPNFTIYLLYTSPIQYPPPTLTRTKNENIFRELLKYKNIKIRRVDLRKYTKDTPLHEWYQTGELQKSVYANSHASDVLRYLSLWRYGGTYLDLDVVVMKSLDDLGYNFAGAECNESVAAGVLNFDYANYGHELAEKCLSEIRLNFRGDDWGYNGPGVITRVLKKTCRTRNVKSMNAENCKGFTVLPPSAFYPIHWKNWSLYFDSEQLESALKQVKVSYAIHVWNKFSYNRKVMTKEKSVAYGDIASKYCPNVYRESGDEF